MVATVTVSNSAPRSLTPTNISPLEIVMQSIPLLTQDDFEPAQHEPRRQLRRNVECHSLPTQIDVVGDAPINHALTAVAQEMAQLLRQAAPAQANGSNSTQTTATLKNEYLSLALLTSNLSSTSVFQVQTTAQSATWICSMPTLISENRSLTHTQLQPAIDYIHAHLDQDLSLVQIAKVVNLSPTYFASLFKRATGISPHEYVIRQRVERAKMMLAKTDLSIADIALQVGFSSQSHLTQQFKRFTGITPKQMCSSP